LRAIKRHQPRELIVSGGAGAAKTDEVFRIGGLMEIVEAHVCRSQPPLSSSWISNTRRAKRQRSTAHGDGESARLRRRNAYCHQPVEASRDRDGHVALKNIAMSFPAADYYGHPRSTQKHENWFFDDMHSFIAAMGKRFPINLAITVGHPAMIATGPLGGHVVKTGLVIASTDPLADDVVGADCSGSAAGRTASLGGHDLALRASRGPDAISEAVRDWSDDDLRQIRCCRKEADSSRMPRTSISRARTRASSRRRATRELAAIIGTCRRARCVRALANVTRTGVAE
jgi:Domain of unknown function (DUF362)